MWFHSSFICSNLWECKIDYFINDVAIDDGCNKNDINLKYFKIHFICGIFDGGCFYYMSSYHLQLLSKKWSLNIESTFLPWVSLKGLLLAYRYIFNTFVVRRLVCDGNVTLLLLTVCYTFHIFLQKKLNPNEFICIPIWHPLENNTCTKGLCNVGF